MSFLEGIQLRQDFGTGGVWVHAGVDLGDFSSWIDKEGVAGSEFGDGEVGEGSVGAGDFALGVGEEFEIQSLLRAEVFMRVDSVQAHAQYNGIVLCILRLVHLELVGFAGSTWCLIFRIEIEDNPVAAIVLETDGSAFLRGQSEIGSGGTRGGNGGAREETGD